LWDDAIVDLSSDFGGSGRWSEARAGARLRALTTLCEVRTKIDLPALMKRMQSPIQSPEENHEHRCVIC